MGYYSDEIDVYSTPHQRMKDAINGFLNRLTITSFDDLYDFKLLLDSLQNAFTEFEIHEKIENECIIQELKMKLKKLSIKNSRVCDCHKDSKLIEMKQIFNNGLKINASQLKDYSLMLRDSLSDFTKTFIPHMDEEEQYFQPLLMTYFTYEELKSIKQTVMFRHSIEGSHLFYGLDKLESSVFSSTDVISSLPQEILEAIFQKLEPKDLIKTSAVNHTWHKICYRPQLWEYVDPLKWKSKFNKTYKENNCSFPDSDYSSDSEQLQIQPLHKYNEIKSLIGIIKYLLPKVGVGVKYLNLANHQKLNNYFLKKILKLCPNLEHLDLSFTNISDASFTNLYNEPGTLKHLRVLNVSGCTQLSDLGLLYLSRGICNIHNSSHEETHVIDEITDISDLVNEDINKMLSTIQPFGFDEECSQKSARLCSPEICHIRCCKQQIQSSLLSQNPISVSDTTNTDKKAQNTPIFYKSNALSVSNKEMPKKTTNSMLPRIYNNIESIDLSGCYNITDRGLQFLTCDYLLHYYLALSVRETSSAYNLLFKSESSNHFPITTLPNLKYLNLSGLPRLSTLGLAYFLGFCNLDNLYSENIYYCDNLIPLDSSMGLEGIGELPGNLFGQINQKYFKDFKDYHTFLLAMNEILKQSNGCLNCQGALLDSPDPLTEGDGEAYPLINFTNLDNSMHNLSGQQPPPSLFCCR